MLYRYVHLLYPQFLTVSYFQQCPRSRLLRGGAYCIHALATYQFTETFPDRSNIGINLRATLHNALIKHLNLSQVQPSKLQFIHAKSDNLAIKIATVTGVGLALFTNPIFAVTGYCLVMTAAKIGCMYYMPRQASLI